MWPDGPAPSSVDALGMIPIGRTSGPFQPMSEEGTITVVLADDHPVVRSGLRMLLEAEDDLEVVAEAGDVDAARRSVLGHKPTVLVLDLGIAGAFIEHYGTAATGERFRLTFRWQGDDIEFECKVDGCTVLNR